MSTHGGSPVIDAPELLPGRSDGLATHEGKPFGARALVTHYLRLKLLGGNVLASEAEASRSSGRGRKVHWMTLLKWNHSNQRPRRHSPAPRIPRVFERTQISTIFRDFQVS